MNTSEINRTLGIFTEKEKHLRASLYLYSEKIHEIETAILNLARQEEIQAVGGKKLEFEILSDSLIRTQRLIEETRQELRELEAELDTLG